MKVSSSRALLLYSVSLVTMMNAVAFAFDKRPPLSISTTRGGGAADVARSVAKDPPPLFGTL